MIAPLVVLAVLQAPALQISFDPRRGLSLSGGGVPVVRGSYLQVFEPDWSKGYYSSFNSPMEVAARPDGGVEGGFRGPDGQVEGHLEVARTSAGARVRLRLRWSGAKPARAEWCVGLVWLPAFRGGTVAGKALAQDGPSAPGIDARLLGPDAPAWRFEGPAGTLAFGGAHPATAFDARGYGQPWAVGRDLAWVGHLAVDLQPGVWTELEHTWTFAAARQPPTRTDSGTLDAETAEGVLTPPTERPPLIPTPKEAHLDWQRPVRLDTRGLGDLLGARWLAAPSTGVPVRRSLTELGLPPEGYEITASPDEVAVRGQDEAGLAHGLRRLAALAFPYEGTLAVPTGTVRDWPAVPWRGVHLFVGPTALRFHQFLWGRALLDLGFNKAVIQCERAAWKCLPGTETPITMPLENLAELFDWYRAQGVEPIPLVQSFGHMEWFFANGQNRDAMFNPDVPYSIDPRKPAARAKLEALWAEVAQLLKPKAFHFGLDEVDMRGWPDDPELVTELWNLHMPFLAQIAARHEATMMLWGDKALAPGEAVDATHGHSVEHAARRRAAIPKGAVITDWHYRADADPATFAPSLDLWQREGYGAIASTWYRPENIRGFGAAAAQRRGVGLLQTTWAGYESGMEGLLREWHQFSAMVLAGEVAWTGKPDAPAWDPGEVLATLLFGRPQAAAPVAGTAFGDGLFRTFAGVRMRSMDRPLRGVLDPATRYAPTGLMFRAEVPPGRLAIALECAEKADEGEPIAVVAVDGHETTVLYGRHVRARTDPGSTLFAPREEGVSVLFFEVPSGAGSVEVRALNPYSGLRVKGLAGF